MPAQTRKQGGEKRGVRDGWRLFTELIKKHAALTRHLTLSLTGEATAAAEVQALHVFGDDECTDITCGKRGGENKEEGDSEE